MWLLIHDTDMQRGLGFSKKKEELSLHAAEASCKITNVVPSASFCYNNLRKPIYSH